MINPPLPQLATQILKELPLSLSLNALSRGGYPQLLGQHHHGLGDGAISRFGTDAGNKIAVNLQAGDGELM